MNTIVLKNKVNGELFQCDDLKNVTSIDGIEYIWVHPLNQSRTFKMRKDTFEKVPREKL